MILKRCYESGGFPLLVDCGGSRRREVAYSVAAVQELDRVLSEDSLRGSVVRLYSSLTSIIVLQLLYQRSGNNYS